MYDTRLVELHRKESSFIFIFVRISRCFLWLNLIAFKLFGIIYVSEGWCIEIFIVIQWNFRLGNFISNFNSTILFRNCELHVNGYGLLVTLFFIKICIKVSCDHCGGYFSIPTAGIRKGIIQTNLKPEIVLFFVVNDAFDNQRLRIRTKVLKSLRQLVFHCLFLLVSDVTHFINHLIARLRFDFYFSFFTLSIEI